jgi:DNA-binding NarL/FixJ family response regulator
VLPYIKKLRVKRLDAQRIDLLNILESNMLDIISPFSLKLSSPNICFTPKEIQVANLIKEGKQSKDISELLQVTFETVNCHRQNIRKKLGIQNNKTNLRTYLLSLSD